MAGGGSEQQQQREEETDVHLMEVDRSDPAYVDSPGEFGAKPPETLPSRFLASIDLPEPTINKTTSGFVYNRFEAAERTSRIENTQMSAFKSLDDAEFQNRMQSKYTQPARYVKINFSSPAEFGVSLDTIRNSETYNNSLLKNIVNKISSLNIDIGKVLSEGGLSNFYFSGTELIDTLADKKIYTFLSASVILAGLDNALADSSPKSAAQILVDRTDTLGKGSAFVEDVLSDLGVQNITVSKQEDSKKNSFTKRRTKKT